MLSEAQVPVVVEVQSQKDVRSSWCNSRSPKTKPGPRAKAAAIVEAIATKIGGRDFLY